MNATHRGCRRALTSLQHSYNARATPKRNLIMPYCRNLSYLLCHWRSGLAGLLMIVAGCATAPANTPFTLAGTQWTLQSIQSMDDTQGTTSVADGKRYTLHFAADGRASLRLDCNRGTGSWEARPGESDSGSLRLSAIAMTRALCPPPSLDTRIARDLGHVRSYRVIDGRLYLSLFADGGIYEWRRIAE